MRVGSVLLALLTVLSAGCLDDDPVGGEGLDAADADAPAPEASEAVAATGKPRVKTVEGGWTAQAGPARLQGFLPPEFEVPHEATWILEITWDANPTTQEMSFELFGKETKTFSGTSPLRVEFPANAPTGTLAIDSANPVAVETFFTAHVSIFDGIPFDAEWSALDA